MLNQLFIPSHRQYIPSNLNHDDVMVYGRRLTYLYNEGNLCNIPWTVTRQKSGAVSFESTQINLITKKTTTTKSLWISTNQTIPHANYSKIVLFSNNTGKSSDVKIAIANDPSFWTGVNKADFEPYGTNYCAYIIANQTEGSRSSDDHLEVTSWDMTGPFDYSYTELDLSRVPVNCPNNVYINIGYGGQLNVSASTSYIKRVFLVS